MAKGCNGCYGGTYNSEPFNASLINKNYAFDNSPGDKYKLNRNFTKPSLFKDEDISNKLYAFEKPSLSQDQTPIFYRFNFTTKPPVAYTVSTTTFYHNSVNGNI